MTDNELIERVLNIITKLSRAYQNLISSGGNRDKEYEEDLDYMLQLVDLVEKQKAEIERLNGYLDVISCSTDKIKAAVIQKCIEKIKARSGKVVIVSDGIEITDLTNYTISEYDLRNIKKEIVGETND